MSEQHPNPANDEHTEASAQGALEQDFQSNAFDKSAPDQEAAALLRTLHENPTATPEDYPHASAEQPDSAGERSPSDSVQPIDSARVRNGQSKGENTEIPMQSEHDDPTSTPKYHIKVPFGPNEDQVPLSSRLDFEHQPQMSKRKEHLPTMYSLWWMATLVFFLLSSGLGAFHALQYWGYDPLGLRVTDFQDKVVFLSLAGSLLGSLFLVWVLQNTAKGLTSKKLDPVTAYNNVYAVMICLLIVGSLKMTSDVMAQTTDARSGGQLEWLRSHAYGTPENEYSVVDTPAGSSKVASVSPFAPAALDPEQPAGISSTGRNLPQAKNEPRVVRGGDRGGTRGGHASIRLGDPSKPVMAASMRTFQEAAGRVRRADEVVASTPQPDLASLATVEPIEAIAAAHLAAFQAHLDLSRVAKTLPGTAELGMLEAGCDVKHTNTQVASLMSLLSLKTAAEVHNAEAAMHGARASYAGFLAQHFGGWTAEGGKVTFEDAQIGAKAAELQAAIGQREMELKAVKFDAAGG